MHYQVTISQRGFTIGHPIVEAPSALEAIDQVEDRYDDQKERVIMSIGKNTLIQVDWTGLTFQARRVAGKA